MNLIEATFILALAVIIIILLLYFAISHFAPSKVTEQQATTLILNDLLKNYPYANVTLDNVTPSIYPGSWHVLVSVVFNATSPCPAYYIYAYDYPKFGFVPTNINNYTGDCVINGFTSNKTFLFTSYPAAITRATDLHLPQVQNYISEFGYSNVSVHASFFNYTKAENKTYANVWLVNYSAAKAKYAVYVMISQLNGTLIATYNLTK